MVVVKWQVWQERITELSLLHGSTACIGDLVSCRVGIFCISVECAGRILSKSKNISFAFREALLIISKEKKQVKQILTSLLTKLSICVPIYWLHSSSPSIGNALFRESSFIMLSCRRMELNACMELYGIKKTLLLSNLNYFDISAHFFSRISSNSFS